MSPIYVPALQPANNLSDVASAAGARTNLALDGAWRPQDYSLTGWSFDPGVFVSSTILPAAGTVFVSRIKIATAQNITNVVLYLATAGATLTAGQCFAALYQGTTLLGTTADQQTAWQSSGVKTMALVGGPFAVTAGDVLVAFFANGTTLPTLGRGGAIAGVNLGLASPRFATADTGRTTTMPSPLGTLTATSTAYWAGVS